MNRRFLPSGIFIPRLFRLAFLVIVVSLINVVLIGTGNSPLNWYLTIVWTAFFPLAVTGTIGALAAQNIKVAHTDRKTDQKVIFLVPTIARLGNLDALFRVVDSILALAPYNLTNFRVDIVTEETSEGNGVINMRYLGNADVRLVIIPKSYQTPNGTKYKARANQYALQQRLRDDEVGSDIWVYHLDDDTAVGRDTISAISLFLLNDSGKYHLAQGVLTFPFENSDSLFCKLADSVRPSDDLTKFYFYTEVLATPLSGLHGEHLLIRSNIENNIGWDFGPNSITEDAEFALNFLTRYPRSSTFLAAATYGASPQSLSDLVKQRRRWARGLIDLVIRAKVPSLLKIPIAYQVFTWVTGFFQNIFFVILLLLVTNSQNTAPVTPYLLMIWSFNFAYQLWLYWEGLRINMAVSAKPQNAFKYILLLLPGFLLFSLVESISTLLGLMDYLSRKKGFVVISKPS